MVLVDPGHEDLMVKVDEEVRQGILSAVRNSTRRYLETENLSASGGLARNRSLIPPEPVALTESPERARPRVGAGKVGGSPKQQPFHPARPAGAGG